MTKGIVSLALAGTLALAVAACKKPQEEPTPQPQPEEKLEINIHSPANHSHFHHGDTIFIKATITSPQTLHGYDVYLRQGQDTFWHHHDHLHATTLEVDEYWVNDGHRTGEMMLGVAAATDHFGGRETKELMVHCEH